MARKKTTSAKRRARTSSRSSQRRRGVAPSRGARRPKKAAPRKAKPKKSAKARGRKRRARTAKRRTAKKASKGAPGRRVGNPYRTAKVELYRLRAANGRSVRQATLVRFADGAVVKFIERLPKGEAIRQALAQLARPKRPNPILMTLTNPELAERLASAKAKLAAARRAGNRESELLWVDLVNTLETLERSRLRRNPGTIHLRDLGVGKLFRFTDGPAVYVARGNGWYGPKGGGMRIDVGPDGYTGSFNPPVVPVNDPAWTPAHERAFQRNPAKRVNARRPLHKKAKRPAAKTAKRTSTTVVRSVTTRTTKTNPQKAKRNCAPCALVNPSKGIAVGMQIRWRDMPAAIKRDPRARAAAMAEARFSGCKLDDVICERTDQIPEGMSPYAIHVGDTLGVQYRPPKGSARAFADWNHRAGDQGRGKQRTRPAALVVDARTKAQYFLPRRGSRLKFSSRRGLIG